MKCCDHCEVMAEGAKVKGIWIDDVYNICSFVEDRSERKNENGYMVCELKSIEKIIQERRGRKRKQVEK